MNICVPGEITGELNELVISLKEKCRLEGYRYMIGNPEGAQLKGFNDSEWNVADKCVHFNRDQGITWFRLKIEVPEYIMDIPVGNSQLRLTDFSLLAPTDVYIDGKLVLSERTWCDFTLPEVVISNNAIPGQVFNVAIKLTLEDNCYFDTDIFMEEPDLADHRAFRMSLTADAVEDAIFEILSFIEELGYACRFKEVESILPKVFGMISQSLKNKNKVLDLVKTIKVCREILKPMQSSAKKNVVHLVGHAHIDMNWFWSMDETLDILRRDFGTMTQIMQEKPEFKFSQSQCATYEMTEKNFPDIFEKMKSFMESGNWETTASAWVEGDMNMASGESLVRHILYSKKYLKEKFNKEPRIMWCHDTFGHSSNVPQILKKGGIDYYFFGRCGHSDPLFWWEGLDGSKVLTANVYDRPARVSCKFNDAYDLKNSMVVYGVGDHGGGPTRRSIERFKRQAFFPTMPKLVFSTAQTFFDSVVDEKSLSIPVEKGELNFIFDGCYTTHADIKKYNRQCENKLVSAETTGAISRVLGLEYDGADIENCWKHTLFNQFHDILGGCGIKSTYEYSDDLAKDVLNKMHSLSEDMIKEIGKGIKVKNNGKAYIVFNSIGWKRSGCVRIRKPEKEAAGYRVTDAEGNVLSSQATDDYLYIRITDVPSVGYTVIYLNREDAERPFEKINEDQNYYKIQTKYFNISIRKESGEIVRLYDKENNKMVADKLSVARRDRKGILNTLEMHWEVPVHFNAWSIGETASMTSLKSGAKATIKEDGPVVKIISIEHQVSHSVINQDIIIYNDDRRIDFVTHVDWNEVGGKEKGTPMLRASFDPDISNQSATYEIPFGAIDRPCINQEMPALKWIDISDGQYGFSLLNNCKYGHKVKGNVVEINLIRSSWEPDTASDIGSHDFTYSIFPHKGSWKQSETIKESYSLNNELIVMPIMQSVNPELPETASFIEIDNSNVVLSAFKPAESGEGFILRFYEGAGIAAHVNVRQGFTFDSVEEVDLNEGLINVKVNNNGIDFRFDIGCFEIKTFKIRMSLD